MHCFSVFRFRFRRKNIRMKSSKRLPKKNRTPCRKKQSREKAVLHRRRMGRKKTAGKIWNPKRRTKQRNPGCAEVIVTGMNGYAIKEVLTFRIIDKSEPEKEDSGSSSPIPTVIPQAYASARHASPNTSDPFSSAKHWMVFMTSGLTALGSLLVLRHRR